MNISYCLFIFFRRMSIFNETYQNICLNMFIYIYIEMCTLTLKHQLLPQNTPKSPIYTFGNICLKRIHLFRFYDTINISYTSTRILFGVTRWYNIYIYICNYTKKKWAKQLSLVPPTLSRFLRCFRRCRRFVCFNPWIRGNGIGNCANFWKGLQVDAECLQGSALP